MKLSQRDVACQCVGGAGAVVSCAGMIVSPAAGLLVSMWNIVQGRAAMPHSLCPRFGRSKRGRSNAHVATLGGTDFRRPYQDMSGPRTGG